MSGAVRAGRPARHTAFQPRYGRRPDALAPATVAATISFVGITIKPPTQYFRRLWSAINAALPRAVTLVRRLLDE